jgi:hypothetical protein
MKILLTTVMLCSLSFAALAEEGRTYNRKGNEATIEISEMEEGPQAAAYVDGQENEKFINDLLKDPESELYKLARQIEQENCEETSKPDEPWIDGCGEVTVTKEIRTSFGRGGWAGAGAVYTFFIGFTNAGTGHFFDVSHMINISEGVEAQTNDDGEFSGKLIKTLSLGTIKKLESSLN